MAYMNYKEGTGVRARSDLSANVRPEEPAAMTLEQIVKAAEWLSGQVHEARRRKEHYIAIPTNTADRLATAMIETVNHGVRP